MQSLNLIKYIPATVFVAGMFFCSCNWAKEKTKETVNKAGEVVAKAGSEFADGVSKGIEKTFENKVEFSKQLQDMGLSTGKIIIHGSDSSIDNILTAYIIFNKDFDKEIMIRVFSPEGQEYGRCKTRIIGLKDEARYVDFIFDNRTNIDGKGKLSFE